jgi:hypothetical protein
MVGQILSLFSFFFSDFLSYLLELKNWNMIYIKIENWNINTQNYMDHICKSWKFQGLK